MCDIFWGLEISGARQSLCKRGRGMSPILFLFFSRTLNVAWLEAGRDWNGSRRPLGMTGTVPRLTGDMAGNTLVETGTICGKGEEVAW